MSDTGQGMEPKELREAFEKTKAELNQAKAELRSFKTEVTFKEQGLTPKHAQLFLAANPDAEVSPEIVQNFAAEYGLQPANTEEAVPARQEEGHLPADGSPPAVERTLADGPRPVSDQTLASLQGAAGTPAGSFASADPAKMSQDQFQSLLQTNPSEAAKAYAEGRVERHKDNVQADWLAAKGIIR